MALTARFHGPGDLRVADEPVPVVPPGSSLVEVTAVGLCGSDLHWYAEGGIGEARLTRPLVGGHEMAGVIRGGPRGGLRVAIDPAIPCRRCDLCLRGHANLCRAIVFAGHSTCDGGLRQLMAWPDAQLFALPDRIDDAEGAMLEPLGVAVHAVDLAHTQVAQTAAVIGCGPIGLCLIEVLRTAGVRVVLASDPLPHRRDAAMRHGAEIALDPDSPGYPDQLLAGTSGFGVDLAFEAAGNDAGIAAAVEAVRPGGRVMLVGIPSTDDSTFPASVARRKGLSLIMVRRMKDVYERTIELVASGRVDVAAMVSHRFELTDVLEAFSVAVARPGLKVLVEPNRHG